MLGRQWMWELRPSRGQARDQRAARAGGPAGPADDDLAGRDPQLLHSGVPGQAGRGAGAVHVALVPADQAGAVPPVLRRVLRDQALGDDRLGGGDGAGRVPAVARGGDDRGVDGGRGRAAVPSAGLQRLPRGQRDGPCAACSTASTATRCRWREARSSQADERYIRDSILLPQSQVVAGYKPGDADLPGPHQRGRAAQDHRLHQGDRKEGEGRADEQPAELRAPAQELSDRQLRHQVVAADDRPQADRRSCT